MSQKLADRRQINRCQACHRSKMASRRTYTHLLLREQQNCKLLLNNHQQDNVRSHQEDTPDPKAKEKAQQDGRRGEITFRIKPHIHQRPSEGSNKTLCAAGPRNPTETEPDLLWGVWVSPVESQVSGGLPGGQALWLQQTCVMQHYPS